MRSQHPRLSAWYRRRQARKDKEARREARRDRRWSRRGLRPAHPLSRGRGGRPYREPPEARLVREHAHEPMPQLDLVDVPQALSMAGVGADGRTWLEEALGQDLPAHHVSGEGYTRPVVSGQIAVSAKVGMQPVVTEVKPGLYVVGTVPESMIRPEVGFVPLVLPLLSAVVKAVAPPIQKAIQNGQARKAQQAQAQTAPQPSPAVVPAASSQTAGCGCGCARCQERAR